MTGRELVTAALRLIGAIAPGESIAASEATDGLATLNRMIGSWSNDQLLIYAETKDTLTLTPNTAAYTVGTAGTFNTSRPQQIYKAVIRDESNTPAQEYELNILTLSEWTRIVSKEVTASIPTDIYDDGNYPLRTVTLYPVPSEAKKLVLYSSKAITALATLDTAVSLPPGYEEAMIYNLAMRLSPEYGKPVPDAVGLIANESLANIKRANRRPAVLAVDPAIVARGAFDIIGGDTR